MLTTRKIATESAAGILRTILGSSAAGATLAICVSAAPTAPTSATQERVETASVRHQTPDDLEFARAAAVQGDLQLALSHLARRLDRLPDDAEALTVMAKCVRDLTGAACRRGEHMEALEFLTQLSLRVAKARAERFAPDAPSTPLNDLLERERDLQQITNCITFSADEQAAPRIDSAMRLAEQAHHHWYTFRPNNRDKVREALRELRWVHERGPALSKDMVGRYQQANDRLKPLVADPEWQSLRAEAGYVRKGGGI